jgi:hypothetical protein
MEEMFEIVMVIGVEVCEAPPSAANAPVDNKAIRPNAKHFIFIVNSV